MNINFDEPPAPRGFGKADQGRPHFDEPPKPQMDADHGTVEEPTPDRIGPEDPAEEITRVLQEHQQSLLAIEGVNGVGIQRDQIGRDVIAVYLRDRSAASRLPAQVGGYRVVPVISGDFDILPA